MGLHIYTVVRTGMEADHGATQGNGEGLLEDADHTEGVRYEF